MENARDHLNNSVSTWSTCMLNLWIRLYALVGGMGPEYESCECHFLQMIDQNFSESLHGLLRTYSEFGVYREQKKNNPAI